MKATHYTYSLRNIGGWHYTVPVVEDFFTFDSRSFKDIYRWSFIVLAHRISPTVDTYVLLWRTLYSTFYHRHHSKMSPKSFLLVAYFPPKITDKWFLSCVKSIVNNKIWPLIKAFPTNFTFLSSVFSCILVNLFPQLSQPNGYSPTWTLMFGLRLPVAVSLFPRTLQTNGFSLLCIIIC